MNNERVVEDIITTFLLNTCRLRPQLTQTAVQAAMRCVQTAACLLYTSDAADE